MTKKSKKPVPYETQEVAFEAAPLQQFKMITKAKITNKGTLECNYKFRTEDGIWHQSSETSDGQVHKDLNEAFSSLIIHLINLCDQKGAPMDLKSTMLDTYLPQYLITGFVITGTGDDEGIMIMGQRLIGNKSMNIISPGCQISDDYDLVSELFESIEACKHEALEYLNGKFAAKQLHMEFEEQA